MLCIRPLIGTTITQATTRTGNDTGKGSTSAASSDALEAAADGVASGLQFPQVAEERQPSRSPVRSPSSRACGRKHGRPPESPRIAPVPGKRVLESCASPREKQIQSKRHQAEAEHCQPYDPREAETGLSLGIHSKPGEGPPATGCILDQQGAGLNGISLMTASGKPIAAGKNLTKAANLFADLFEDQPAPAHSAAASEKPLLEPSPAFQLTTASGKKLEVGKAALERGRQFMSELHARTPVAEGGSNAQSSAAAQSNLQAALPATHAAAEAGVVGRASCLHSGGRGPGVATMQPVAKEQGLPALQEQGKI